jgi:predicted nucleic acid-binding protein
LIVVDASLFAAWLLNEPGYGADDALWDLVTVETIFVPDHWPNEIANALRRAVRTKRITVDEIALITERVTVFDIGFAGPTPIDEIGSLAQDALKNELSTYDMTYVRLARERQLALATVDQAMRRAATRLNIPVLPATAG